MVHRPERPGSAAPDCGGRAVRLRHRMAPAAVLTLGLAVALAAPVAAQPMTAAQEAATVAGFEMSTRAGDLFAGGRYPEAEAMFRDVLQRHLDAQSDPLSIAAALHNVAAAVAAGGRPAAAEPLARQALELRLANAAVANAQASSLRLLASILNDLGHYAEARPLQEQAVMLALDGDGVDPATLVRSFATLAYLTAADGDVDGGIELVNQLVPLLPQMPPHDVALTLNILGRLSSMSGKPDQAEAFYRQAVGRSASIPVSGDWTVTDKAAVLGNFAAMLRLRGRWDEAEGLFLRADAMLRDAGLLGLDARANLLDGLGEVWRATGRYRDAYAAEREALDIRLAVLPADHPSIGVSFSNIGLTLLRDGQAELAAQSFERALAVQRRAGDGLRIANAALNLAAARAALGQTDAAIDLGAGAVAALAGLLPQGHPQAVNAGFNLAWLHLAGGRNPDALAVARDAFAAYRANSWRLGSDETVGASEIRDARRQILSVAVALWETAGSAGIDEAFQAAQWAQASEAGHVARRVAARFAAGDGRIAELARARQDLADLWRATDAQYLSRLSAAGEADERTAALRAHADALAAEIAAADARLASEFPAYVALTRPGAASLGAVQAALGSGEAFLMPVSTPDETYVFAVSATAAVWTRVAMTDAEVETAVRRLRADLDPAGPSRAAVSLQIKQPAPAIRFDVLAARQLFDMLIAPVAGVLDGHDTIMVVQEGALAGLPLSVLLTGPLDTGSDEPLRAAPWLARRHGFVTLPSAAALVAGRQARNPRAATRDFAGFGDPVFAGPGGPVRAGGPDVGGLQPLPGTRREIAALARSLGAGDDAVFLGPEATEARVKTSDAVAEARILVFATHGLVAGDLSGLAEPALAFSAPAEPGAVDDGLLTASEAAQLDLAAEWVILSACNTAAPDGTPGGEGLSGLASAFLYAGARSLLVSHWPVRDDAAGLLTLGAVEAARRSPELGHAGALRAAMLALIDGGTIPDAAHPATWAPFAVVGANGG